MNKFESQLLQIDDLSHSLITLLFCEEETKFKSLKEVKRMLPNMVYVEAQSTQYVEPQGCDWWACGRCITILAGCRAAGIDINTCARNNNCTRCIDC